MISFLKIIQNSVVRSRTTKLGLTLATSTTELLQEFNINFIEWSPKGAELNQIELRFGETQRRAKEH